MNKFYDKQIANNVGHEAALEVALKGAELSAEIDSLNAIRHARGLPSLQEEDEAFQREIREIIAECGEDGLDPLLVAEVLGRPITDEIREASDRFLGL